MNLKGKVESTLIRKEVFITYIISQDKKYKISSKTEMESIPKGILVNFVNIGYQKKFFGSEYALNEKSFVVLHPGLSIIPEEIVTSFDNKYSSAIIEFASVEGEKLSAEKILYNTLRSYIDEDSRYKIISERLPKDIKAKFSFKPFEISTAFGLMIMDSLYLGKSPIAFKENELKARIQTIISNSDKYILIDDDGTLREEKMDIKEKQSLISKRNAIAQVFFSDSHKEILEIECESANPAYKYISLIKEKPEEFDNFEKYFSIFLKDEYKRRTAFRKILQSGVNPRKTSVQIRSAQGSLFELSAKIDENEGLLREKQQIVVVEKPPLDRKTLGTVEQITFDEIKTTLDAPVVNAEFITSADLERPQYAGLLAYIYSDTIPAKISKGETVPSVAISENSYIEGDTEQNKAVNLILSTSPLVLIKGDYGTGKKFTAKRAIEELAKSDVRIAIATDSRKEEFQRIFSGDKIKVLDEADLLANDEENLFDVALIFVEHSFEQNYVPRVLAIAKKVAIFALCDVRSDIEAKVPTECIVELHSEHRFGKSMMHFINKLGESNLSVLEDKTLEIINKDNIDKEFVQIVNPEKFVQFVSISSKVSGKKNKWNAAEAQFTVEAIAQFVKGGVDRSNIGVIVPYERQKKLIEKLLAEKKIPDIEIAELPDAFEKEVVLINFVECDALTSKLKNEHYLKFALTRAKNKMILVGNNTLAKKENLIRKLIGK